jgi:hypothetical protein
MKRSPSQKKKDREVNATYPQFIFRTSGKASKDFLDDMIEKVILAREKIPPFKKAKKNEVVVEALTIGLEHLLEKAKNGRK